MPRGLIFLSLISAFWMILGQASAAADPPSCSAKSAQWQEMSNPSRADRFRFRSTVPIQCVDLLASIDNKVPDVPLPVGPLATLRLRSFILEIDYCRVTDSGAECLGAITAARGRSWAVSGRDHLVDRDGKLISISAVRMGDFDGPVSPQDSYHAPKVALSERLRVPFVYKFYGDFNPADIQGLNLYVEGNIPHTIAPVPWKY